MPKKKDKKAAKISKKELEIRIEEERQKLEQLKKKAKSIKKSSKPKKQKKDKDISDKVKIKKPKTEDLQKKIDYHKFLEAQMTKLDYSTMFNYLGGGIKSVAYSYSEGDSGKMQALQKKYETLTWEEVTEVTQEEKMNHIMGINRNFEVNGKREAYKWWKVFNKGLGELLYQVSMT